MEGSPKESTGEKRILPEGKTVRPWLGGSGGDDEEEQPQNPPGITPTPVPDGFDENDQAEGGDDPPAPGR